MAGILHPWLTFSPGLGSVVEFSGAALLQEILTLGVDPDAAELLQIFRHLDLANTNHTDEYVRGRNFLPCGFSAYSSVLMVFRRSNLFTIFIVLSVLLRRCSI